MFRKSSVFPAVKHVQEALGPSSEHIEGRGIALGVQFQSLSGDRGFPS